VVWQHARCARRASRTGHATPRDADEEYGAAVATLEEVRLRRRLTQRALAARSEVSLSTIQAIEAGRAGRVRFGTMERLADVLGVEPEAIDDFAPSFLPRHRSRGEAPSDAD
jgi:transcriptional regulator with XRE-family HTH domain